MIGQQIGSYEITELLGVGGMAAVYKAYDSSTDRYVAIKVLLEQYARDEEFRARFDREAHSIALLEHAHILPIYAYGEQNGLLYLVLRYMPAGSLGARISEEGPLPLEVVSQLLEQVASALDYAHQCGVIHRDLKTENVLLDANYNAFLADFGLVKLLSDAPRLTGNVILGTPAFMSPEQCLGADTLTPASDQYGLGIVLYHMVTGRLPFESTNSLAIVRMQIQQAPPPPSQLRPDLPGSAEKAMLKALAKAPEDRYPTCIALAEAFSRAVSGSQRLGERIGGSVGRRINVALTRLEDTKDDGSLDES